MNKVVHLQYCKQKGDPMIIMKELIILRSGVKNDRWERGQVKIFGIRWVTWLLNLFRKEQKKAKVSNVTIIGLPGILEANEELMKHSALFGKDFSGFSPEQLRRNIVVDGISPEEMECLYRKPFFIGGIKFLGVQECTPCKVPLIRCEKLSADKLNASAQIKIFKDAFSKFRGGLRAQPLGKGKIRLGDVLVIEPSRTIITMSPRPTLAPA